MDCFIFYQEETKTVLAIMLLVDNKYLYFGQRGSLNQALMSFAQTPTESAIFYIIRFSVDINYCFGLLKGSTLFLVCYGFDTDFIFYAPTEGGHLDLPLSARPNIFMIVISNRGIRVLWAHF